MRYWGFFIGKVATAAAILYGLLQSLNLIWPPLATVRLRHYTYRPSRFAYDLPYTTAVMIWFLLCSAALYFIIWDQRYRCRVCLRRLRMPVETGSWSRMLQFGRPRIEYICPYGHGTLREDEVQLSGGANAEWTPHSDDIWAELCAAGKDSDDRP